MRTWRNLLATLLGEHDAAGFASRQLPDTGNQKNLTEIPWVTTNFVAQFCLNAIIVLDFIKDKLPKTLKEAQQLVAGDENAFHRA